jgi:hypothetical protein
MGTEDEILRMIGHPRMIKRDVIGHVVQDQFHAPLREFAPGNGKTLWAAKMGIDYVASYAIGRSVVVLRKKVRQGSPEIVNQSLILIRNRNAGWTSFPNSHQPNSIKAIILESVPLGCRD